ncbi:MAG: acetate--CoA ligase family protein [Desulfobacteraceae bacterium]|nr:acetate--CoA ligase family protein [Desulfobacteraceae bacterium]
MLKKIKPLLDAAAETGWVMEPDAKKILAIAGIDVPESAYCRRLDQALSFAGTNGFPVAAKVVSPEIIHKSDVDGVVVGIEDKAALEKVFDRFSRMDGFTGVHVEEMVAGAELIVGAKTDYQFGPVVMLGIGGTGVEIYRDTAIKMAPLKKADVIAMISSLTAKELIQGYRGSEAVNIGKLVGLMIGFSEMVMEIGDRIESIDLNPVMCSADRCVVADARIILPGGLDGGISTIDQDRDTSNTCITSEGLL